MQTCKPCLCKFLQICVNFFILPTISFVKARKMIVQEKYIEFRLCKVSGSESRGILFPGNLVFYALFACTIFHLYRIGCSFCTLEGVAQVQRKECAHKQPTYNSNLQLEFSLPFFYCNTQHKLQLHDKWHILYKLVCILLVSMNLKTK